MASHEESQLDDLKLKCSVVTLRLEVCFTLEKPGDLPQNNVPGPGREREESSGSTNCAVRAAESP